MLEKQANLITRLALHQSQRYQSIPTLSVLVGKAITARQVWTQWLRTTDRQTAVCVYSSQLALFEAWLSAVVQHYDLRTLVIQWLATLVGQSADQLTVWLANTSDYQSELFWQRIFPISEEAFVLRSLLGARPSTQTSGPQAAATASRWLDHEDAPTLLKNFAIVTQLLPPLSVPGLFVLLPEETAHTELRAALTTLTQLVEAVPKLPVGLVLTAKQEEWVLNRFTESRAKAMVRSGLIEIPAPKQDDLKQWLYERGVRDEERQQTLLDLAQKHGATTESLETAVTLIELADQPQSEASATLYRSQAEQFLFQYLEINPKTVGRFQVNAQLDIAFGGRPMEVDFLDTQAKIVIELDGHYHFGSLDHYRRDRRKDRLLQQHGFLVLRFLSEDVVRDLEGIFDAVDQSLTLR